MGHFALVGFLEMRKVEELKTLLSKSYLRVYKGCPSSPTLHRSAQSKAERPVLTALESLITRCFILEGDSVIFQDSTGEQGMSSSLKMYGVSTGWLFSSVGVFSSVFFWLSSTTLTSGCFRHLSTDGLLSLREISLSWEVWDASALWFWCELWFNRDHTVCVTFLRCGLSSAVWTQEGWLTWQLFEISAD